MSSEKKNLQLNFEGRIFEVQEQEDGNYSVSFDGMTLQKNLSGVARAAEIARKFIRNHVQPQPEKSKKAK